VTMRRVKKTTQKGSVGTHMYTFQANNNQYAALAVHLGSAV